MTLAMVESSSGAASASATNEAIDAGCRRQHEHARRRSCRPRGAGTGTGSPRRSCRRRRGSPRRGPGASLRVDAEQLAVRGHDVGGEQVVDREPVLADEIADAAAEGDPADPDRAGVPERRWPGRGRRPRPCTRAAVRPVWAHAVRPSTSMSSAFMSRQVEDDPALGDAVAGTAVAAAPDGELEAASRARARPRSRRQSRRRPGR